MHAESAPNSDSTMRYSHGASSPAVTSSESASTMWVCGEMGYAATTAGRQRATVSATAREPSTCLSMGVAAPAPGSPRGEASSASRRLAVGDTLAAAGEPLRGSRCADGVQSHDAREASDGADEGGVGQRTSEQLTRQLGRRDGHTAR